MWRREKNIDRRGIIAGDRMSFKFQATLGHQDVAQCVWTSIDLWNIVHYITLHYIILYYIILYNVNCLSFDMFIKTYTNWIDIFCNNQFWGLHFHISTSYVWYRARVM